MLKNWKEIAELTGIVAIVASLVFVGMQLKQAQAVAVAEMDASALANSIEENNAIIENADIWMRGNSGEELEPVEAAIYARLIQITNNLFFFSSQQIIELGQEEALPTYVVEFAAFLYENPGARRVWRAREDRLKRYRGIVRPGEKGTSEWIELIESSLRSFEEQMPEDSQEQ